MIFHTVTTIECIEIEYVFCTFVPPIRNWIYFWLSYIKLNVLKIIDKNAFIVLFVLPGKA